MDSQSIGLKINRLREKQGLTTTELAGLVGISQAQISRLENGKQGFRSATLSRIAEALGVPHLFFFLQEDDSLPADEAVEKLLKLAEALREAEFLRATEKEAELFRSDRAIWRAKARGLPKEAKVSDKA